GPSFDFPITKTLNQKYELVEPDNVQFKTEYVKGDPEYVPGGNNRKPLYPNQYGFTPYYTSNDRIYIAQEGDIPNASGFRFALKFGLQYEIITGSKFYIVPSIYYNLGLTNLSTKESWKVNALQAGVDVRFAL
ncbi:MAG: hypothetical protein Q8M94_04680, partial [Ignavibacteria bacterium]|nr:hypothetical protein [Ignavibacteria bacterium]